MEKWNLYNSSRVHIHRPSCVAQEIQRLNALELEKKIGKSVLGKVGWVYWYCFLEQETSCIYNLHRGLALLVFICAGENNTSIAFCHQPCCIRNIWVQEPMNSICFWPCNVWALLRRIPCWLVRLPFQRHHTGKIQWDGYGVPDPHTLHIGRAELLKTGSTDWLFLPQTIPDNANVN